jgi:Trypsin-co-occurring domain 1
MSPSDEEPVIWIEVSPGPDHGAVPQLSRLRAGSQPISRLDTPVASLVATSLSDLEASLKAITQVVANALTSAAPEEWSVEFGVSFKGSAGLPVIASGEATANLKVTMSWRRK